MATTGFLRDCCKESRMRSSSKHCVRNAKRPINSGGDLSIGAEARPATSLPPLGDAAPRLRQGRRARHTTCPVHKPTCNIGLPSPPSVGRVLKPFCRMSAQNPRTADAGHAPAQEAIRPRPLLTCHAPQGALRPHLRSAQPSTPASPRLTPAVGPLAGAPGFPLL